MRNRLELHRPKAVSVMKQIKMTPLIMINKLPILLHHCTSKVRYERMLNEGHLHVLYDIYYLHIVGHISCDQSLKRLFIYYLFMYLLTYLLIRQFVNLLC